MTKNEFIAILAKKIDNLSNYEAVKIDTVMMLRTRNIEELQSMYETLINKNEED